MEPRDCPSCGSARSVEHGLCQVCLARVDDPDHVIVAMDPPGIEVEEAATEPEAAAGE